MPKKAELSTQPYRGRNSALLCLSLYTQPLLNGKNAKMVPPGIATATLSTQPYRLAQLEQVCLYLCIQMPKKAELSTQPYRLGNSAQVYLSVFTQPLLNGKNAKMVPPGISTATQLSQIYLALFVDIVTPYIYWLFWQIASWPPTTTISWPPGTGECLMCQLVA